MSFSSIEGESAAALETLRAHGRTVEAYFQRTTARLSGAPGRLIEAIEYSLLAGGKRLRPALVLECGRCCAGNDSPPAPTALAAAGAIELIHTFSLVHDDLPAMDDDELRRGRPTNHKVFGEAMAILAGDAMVSMAFEMLARDAEPRMLPALALELAGATGPEGMIGGQVLDIEGENVAMCLEDLQRVHRLKTGALLTTACRMGAIAAGASEDDLSAMTAFGRHLGLAFQIVDDVLDVTSTPQQLGKATNKDAGRGKNTYPALLGLERSKTEAARQLDASLHALDRFGDRAAGLAALARFVVERQV